MGKQSRRKKEEKLRKSAGQPVDRPAVQGVGKRVVTLEDARRVYATEWNISSLSHENNGDYEWMSSFLNGHEKILEIGTGVGRSTLQLVKDGHTVVSVDENVECINAAEQFLRSQGVQVNVIRREQVTMESQSSYAVTYRQPTGIVPLGGVLLMDGDFINDLSLETWLINNGPFDGIACWLLGTHALRAANVSLSSEARTSPSANRLVVQNSVYELADEILRKDGILHVVDRSELPSTEALIQDAINSHKDQASVTSMLVENHSWKALPSFAVAGGVRMVLTPGLSGRVTTENKWALTSITSRKPS